MKKKKTQDNPYNSWYRELHQSAAHHIAEMFSSSEESTTEVVLGDKIIRLAKVGNYTLITLITYNVTRDGRLGMAASGRHPRSVDLGYELQHIDLAQMQANNIKLSDLGPDELQNTAECLSNLFNLKNPRPRIVLPFLNYLITADRNSVSYIPHDKEYGYGGFSVNGMKLTPQDVLRDLEYTVGTPPKVW